MQLELLGTSGCHLCTVAEKIARRIAPPLGASIKLVDIAENVELVERFGTRIPVLKSVDNQILYWPFDEQDLIHWIESL